MKVLGVLALVAAAVVVVMGYVLGRDAPDFGDK